MILVWDYAVASMVSTENDDQKILDINIPNGRDEWCRRFCENIFACESIFGNDHVDLLLKTKYSMFDGPGEHLFHGRLFGNTVTRQSFDTQFVLDVSYALQISPCKIYVKEVFPEQQTGMESGSSRWDVDNVLISFRFYNTTTDHLKELTRQVQEDDSDIYQGRVRAIFRICVDILALYLLIRTIRLPDQ